MGTCFLCDGTGKYKEPNNKQLYEEIFDKLDNTGQYNMNYCRQEALKKSGYTIIDCPRCKGNKE